MRTARLTVFVITALLALPASAHAVAYDVTDLGDTGGPVCGGTCTLRQAITAANASAGADVITFSTAGTIAPATQLPNIVDSVTIDGTVGGTAAILIDGSTM